MKAKVTMEKTFDGGKSFEKVWEGGDFREFFTEEGEYLDTLASIVEEKGKAGEGWRVTYTVEVIK